jgi:hypothetical protein
MFRVSEYVHMQYIIITPSKWEDTGGDYFETGRENTLCLPKVQDLAPDLYTREEEVGGGGGRGGRMAKQDFLSSRLVILHKSSAVHNLDACTFAPCTSVPQFFFWFRSPAFLSTTELEHLPNSSDL